MKKRLNKITDWISCNGVESVSNIGWTIGILVLIVCILSIMLSRGNL